MPMATERKSRTLSLTDDEWALLTTLSEREGRSITRQVIKMAKDAMAEAEKA